MSQIRNQLEQELEELTASLFEVGGRDIELDRSFGKLYQFTPFSSIPYIFLCLRLLTQEAHKMVREANVKQAGAEKQLKEAQGKV